MTDTYESRPPKKTNWWIALLGVLAGFFGGYETGTNTGTGNTIDSTIVAVDTANAGKVNLSNISFDGIKQQFIGAGAFKTINPTEKEIPGASKRFVWDANERAILFTVKPGDYASDNNHVSEKAELVTPLDKNGNPIIEPQSPHTSYYGIKIKLPTDWKPITEGDQQGRKHCTFFQLHKVGDDYHDATSPAFAFDVQDRWAFGSTAGDVDAKNNDLRIVRDLGTDLNLGKWTYWIIKIDFSKQGSRTIYRKNEGGNWSQVFHDENVPTIFYSSLTPSSIINQEVHTGIYVPLQKTVTVRLWIGGFVMGSNLNDLQNYLK